MRRAFDTTLELVEAGDHHEVYGRIFPFGERVRIREFDDAGALDEYEEEFLPGCTTRMQQIAASRGGQPGWIGYTVDHEATFDARIGFCTELSERSEDGHEDGAYARFRLYDDPARIDKVRSMLATSHKGMSIEFIDHPRPLSGSLRQRRSINIAKVTATPIPVYAGAGVITMRAGEALAAGTPRLDEVRAALDAERARFAPPAT